MGNLLRFEFRKLFGQKSFYVCTLLLLLFVFLSAALSKLIAENADDASYPALTTVNILRSSLQSANLPLLLGIFTALFVCTDHTDGTIKNIYAKGYPRTAVYFSKLTAILAAAALFCLAVWCGGALSGTLLFEAGGAPTPALFAALAAQLCTVFGYAGLFFALAMLVRKTGGAIAACIVAPMLFSLLFSTADTLINSQTFRAGDYWLDGLFGTLSQTSVPGETLLAALLLSVAYAAAFTAVGALLHKNRPV